MATGRKLRILTIVDTHWLGLGGPGVVAVSLQAKSEREKSAGRAENAEKFAVLAAGFAPLNATGYINLVRLQLDAGNSDRAIESIEMALGAPFLSDWEEIFGGHVLAAESYLDRKKAGDFAHAATHLARTREMWARNSRLPANQAVVAFYGSAVAGIQQGVDDLTTLSWVCEAVALAGQTQESNPAQVARLALVDEDLAPLNIGAEQSLVLKPEILARLANGDCHSVVNGLLSHGESSEQVAATLRVAIQKAARGEVPADSGFTTR